MTLTVRNLSWCVSERNRSWIGLVGDSLKRYFMQSRPNPFGLSEVLGPRMFVRHETVVSVEAVHDRKFAM